MPLLPSGSPDYESLGQQIKRKHPGKYDSWSNEALGRALALKKTTEEVGLIPEVMSSSLSLIPEARVVVPPALQQKLDEALAGGDPNVLFAWFSRFAISSRIQTRQAQAAEIQSIVSLIQTYTSVYQQALATKHLPLQLARQYQLEGLAHSHSVLQLELTIKIAIAANALADAAFNQGMSLDMYLKQIERKHELEYKRSEKELNLEFRGREIQQDLSKTEEEKRIERLHNRQESEYKIEMVTLAANEYLRRMRQVRTEIDRLHSEIDTLRSNGTISDYLRNQQIANREADLRALEAERERLQQRFGQNNSR